MVLFQDSLSMHWSIDLSDIGAIEEVYLIFDANETIGMWKELPNTKLSSLFEYAMPRFEVRYDTFDCLQRSLLLKDDSIGEPTQIVGGVLGIPGVSIPKSANARGFKSEWNIVWLDDVDTRAFDSGKYADKKIVRLSLAENLKPGHRVVTFEGTSSQIPQIVHGYNKELQEEGIALFTLSFEKLLVPDNFKNIDLGSTTVVLAPQLMKNRKSFQDSLFLHWEKSAANGMVYSWDIGTEGGDKCVPCSGPPPSSSLLKSLGVSEIPSHLYVSSLLFPIGTTRKLTSRSYISFQWIFEMNEPAKGFLDCAKAKEYAIEVAKRKRLEEENLSLLFQEDAAGFLNHQK